jgi:hypothetical protein
MRSCIHGVNALSRVENGELSHAVVVVRILGRRERTVEEVTCGSADYEVGPQHGA